MPSGKPLTSKQKRRITELDEKNLFPSVIAQRIGVATHTVTTFLKSKRK